MEGDIAMPFLTDGTPDIGHSFLANISKLWNAGRVPVMFKENELKDERTGEIVSEPCYSDEDK